MGTLIILILVITYGAAGLVAQYFQLASPTVEFQLTILDASSTGSCGTISILCWQALANVMVFISNIFAYIVNFVIGVLNLITWPATLILHNHVNPYMIAMIFTPLSILAGMTIYKLLRSGSQE